MSDCDGEINIYHSSCPKALVSFAVDKYTLIKIESVGGWIIGVELELFEISQKAINTQTREIKRLVLFTRGLVSGQN